MAGTSNFLRQCHTIHCRRLPLFTMTAAMAEMAGGDNEMLRICDGSSWPSLYPLLPP
jgi:hypothetical protein